ncbi:MAG: 3-oxoacyl-ACP reductase [Rhodospirillaceae bacterium]|nr:3-oxoacyl-ACP reductase [Rhodospirillaceae bacterium]|tara:strand:+ start:66062 stop:66850 length:789 start_codon:yes stop_codon:yes gene_type:complete
MDLGLTDKRALILGGSRGLGQGIAEQLAAEGANVALCGRDGAAMQTQAEELANRTSIKAKGYRLDLTEASSVADLITSVTEEFGGIDIVVNNGGGPPPGAIAAANPEVIEQQFRPVVLSQIEIANAFLPGMRERGWGRILIISSSGAAQPIPNLGISNTLRASLIGWAKTLSTEIAKDGVTVNAIMPGRIHTDRVDQIDANASKAQGIPVEDVVKASHATIPAGRYGTVDEFAKVAAFLVSDCAGYVTGGTIRVDGGYIRSI